MNDLPGSLDRLNDRFDAVEKRLAALEQRIAQLESVERAMAAQPSAAAAGAAPAAAPAAAASALLPEVPSGQAGGIFPVLGRAMLGIAGAYLLRALDEAHVLPAVALESAAILYALVWLAAGAKTRAAFAAAVYACTSVLILAPMLWELTLGFKGLPAAVDALTLAAFVAVAFGLARGPQRRPVVRIASVSAAALSLALAIATHANLPFLGVLLLLAGLCEFAAGEERLARPLIALASDLGVWMLIYLYRAPENTRADYPPLSAFWLIAPGFLLFAIFALGLTLKTARQRQPISIFDTVQATIAFLLAAGGLLYFGPAAKANLLGLLCVVLAMALYAVRFAGLRDPDRRTGFVFGAWSVSLLLAGIWLSAPPAARAECLGAAAIAAVAAGALRGKAVLAGHATAFLLAAAWASGLFAYAFNALAGTPAGAPSLRICLTVLSAVLCYGMVSKRPVLREGQPFPFLFASIAVLAAAALLAQGSVRLAANAFAVEPHHLALIRSFILCAAVLALAFSGAHWRRRELTQIGYAVIALEAVKLVLEDLRHGHLAYVAASVCLFAFTLIAIPRVARRRQAHPAD